MIHCSRSILRPPPPSNLFFFSFIYHHLQGSTKRHPLDYYIIITVENFILYMRVLGENQLVKQSVDNEFNSSDIEIPNVEPTKNASAGASSIAKMKDSAQKHQPTSKTLAKSSRILKAMLSRGHASSRPCSPPLEERRIVWTKPDWPVFCSLTLRAQR